MRIDNSDLSGDAALPWSGPRRRADPSGDSPGAPAARSPAKLLGTSRFVTAQAARESRPDLATLTVQFRRPRPLDVAEIAAAERDLVADLRSGRTHRRSHTRFSSPEVLAR